MDEKTKLSIRSTLMNLVLPLDSFEEIVNLDTLSEIRKATSDKTSLNVDQWVSIAAKRSGISHTILRLVYELCVDFTNRKDNQSVWLLLFTLFLQNVSGKRKRRLGIRKKKTDEETLIDFVSTNFAIFKYVFDNELSSKIFYLIFTNYDDRDIVEISSKEISPDIHGVSSCIKNGKKLVWKLGNPHTENLAKMATTAHLPSVSNRKKIVLCQLINQTLVKNTETVSGSSLLIHRCRNSQIYLPTHLRNVDITKTKHCWVVTGPIKETLRVTGCRSISVVAVAKRIIIQECVDCKFYIFTPREPLIATSCRNLTIAWYNINYDGLEENFKKSGIDPKSSNLFNKPKLVTIGNQLSTNYDDVFQVSNTVKSFIFPLNVDNSKEGDFEEDLKSNVDEWENIIELECLAPFQSRILQNLIDKDFNRFIEHNYKVLNENVQNLT